MQYLPYILLLKANVKHVFSVFILTAFLFCKLHYPLEVPNSIIPGTEHMYNEYLTKLKLKLDKWK